MALKILRISLPLEALLQHPCARARHPSACKVSAERMLDQNGSILCPSACKVSAECPLDHGSCCGALAASVTAELNLRSARGLFLADIPWLSASLRARNEPTTFCQQKELVKGVLVGWTLWGFHIP